MEGEESVHELHIPYLRSCKKEILQPLIGDIKGSIPPWLQGTLLRVGSGLLEVGADKYKHIFDGLALMHKFAIKDGEITYENRFLKSDAYRKNMQHQKIVVSEFGTRGRPDPCKSIFGRFASLFSTDTFTDNDLVNIVRYTDQYYACSETNFIWRVDPDTLESVEKVDLKKFVLLNTASAHPHEDANGTVYNVGYGFLPKASYVLIKFPPKGEACNPFLGGSVIGKITATNSFSPSYFHSFGMSENYFIFVEQSLQMSVPKIVYSHLTWSAYVDCIKWVPDLKTRFHVVRRDTGKVLKTKYVADPLVLFHHINAYEEDGNLVVDLCWCPDGDIVKHLYVEALKELYTSSDKKSDVMMSYARRFVLPIDTKNKKKVGENLVSLANSEAKATLQKEGCILLEPEPLIKDDEYSSEMPRLNYERYNMKKYRYYYSIGKKPGIEQTILLKVDTETKSALTWKEDGVLPSEPVFVAAPDATNEDDGIVLASLLSKTDLRKVTLLVLDAKDMQELGRADFQAEATIPGDFHGIFIPDETSPEEQK